MSVMDGLRAHIEQALEGALSRTVLFDSIIGALPRERLAVDAREDPNSVDTLGSMIDKLTTVNLKMWHNQETLYSIRRMTQDQFVAVYSGDLGELHAIIKRCCDLNVQRSKLMDAIDKHFFAVVSGTARAEVMEQFKTY